MQRNRGLVPLVVCILLWVAACGGAAPAPKPAAPVPTTGGGAAAASPLDVTVGYCCPSATVLPVVVGMQKGLFQQAGVTVHFQQFLQGTATVVQALSAGQIDIAEEIGGPDTVLRATEKGARMKMIGAQETLVPFWIYAKQDLRSLADLRGKTVVFGGLGGPGWTFAAVMLASGGLTPKDVQVIQNGNDGQRLGLLISGRADAATLNLPENFRAEQKGYHKLVYIGDVVPNTVQVIGASEDAIENKPKAILGFMRGLQASVDYIKAHPDEASRIYADWEKTDAEQAQQSVAINVPLYDLNLTTSEMLDFFKMDQKVGMWEGPLPTESQLAANVDDSFLKALNLHQ